MRRLRDAVVRGCRDTERSIGSALLKSVDYIAMIGVAGVRGSFQNISGISKTDPILASISGQIHHFVVVVLPFYSVILRLLQAGA
jgi:hypothetical protein